MDNHRTPNPPQVPPAPAEGEGHAPRRRTSRLAIWDGMDRASPRLAHRESHDREWRPLGDDFEGEQKLFSAGPLGGLSPRKVAKITGASRGMLREAPCS